MYGRIVLSILAPSLLFLTVGASSAQVMCIRGPNGAVFCGPPAQQSDAGRHRGANEFERGRQSRRLANGERGGFEERSQPRPELIAGRSQRELEQARAARRFYSERLREAMTRERNLEHGRGAPPERIGSLDPRRPIGAGGRYAPPPRYTQRAPSRFAERGRPRSPDLRREPYPASRVAGYPPQHRIPRTRLTEREPFPPPGARPSTRGALYREPPHRLQGQPGFRGPRPDLGAGPARPPMSREEALEQLRRQYNLGGGGGMPPVIRGPSSPIGDPNQPFGPPPGPQGSSEHPPSTSAGT